MGRVEPAGSRGNCHSRYDAGGWEHGRQLSSTLQTSLAPPAASLNFALMALAVNSPVGGQRLSLINPQPRLPEVVPDKRQYAVRPVPGRVTASAMVPVRDEAPQSEG